MKFAKILPREGIWLILLSRIAKNVDDTLLKKKAKESPKAKSVKNINDRSTIVSKPKRLKNETTRFENIDSDIEGLKQMHTVIIKA